MLGRFNRYMRSQLSCFRKESLWSARDINEGMLIIFCWAIPAFLIVCLVEYFHDYLPANYLKAAVSEGIGPHLWNVIGVISFVFVGFAILLPRSKFIARCAYHLLVNTYAIRGLSLGLLTGQLLIYSDPVVGSVDLWKAWIISTGLILLVALAFLLNFSFWYLGVLMNSQGKSGGFLHCMESVDLWIRVFAFIFLSILSTVFLFMET